MPFLSTTSFKIILLCVLVTALGYFTDSLDRFALNPLDLALHNWSALLCGILLSPFAHVGILHLLSNTLWLVFLGAQIESQMSEKRFLQFFVFSLVITEMSILAFSSSPVLGMSGFTMALFGYLVTQAVITRQGDAKGGIVMLVIFLALGGQNVSLVAHLAGVISGGVFYVITAKKLLK